jgi:hypothetical protein
MAPQSLFKCLNVSKTDKEREDTVDGGVERDNVHISTGETDINISRSERSHEMLSWVLVSMAWRVLGLRMEETASRNRVQLRKYSLISCRQPTRGWHFSLGFGRGNSSVAERLMDSEGLSPMELFSQKFPRQFSLVLLVKTGHTLDSE